MLDGFDNANIPLDRLRPLAQVIKVPRDAAYLAGNADLEAGHVASMSVLLLHDLQHPEAQILGAASG